MSNNRTDDADRYATGSGGTDDEKEAERDGMRPGTTGGGARSVPDTGRADEGVDAAHAEGTIGAIGEMDFTGAPAGPAGGSGPSGGSGTGASLGGGPGGGAAASGGTGPSSADAGPQSIESTVAVLGDRELSTSSTPESNSGASGGSDIAGDSATTGSADETKDLGTGANG
jgi:hypothetical protein